MTYQNKSAFIDGLRDALSRYGITEQRDILLDFEQHFSDGAAAGETEAQTCEKLGDPEEIAKQYVPEGELSLGEAPKKAETAAEASAGDGFDSANTDKTCQAAQEIDRVFNAEEEERAYFDGNGIRRIDIGIAHANAQILAADTYAAEVFYRSGRSGIRFSARLENGTLFVKETGDLSVPVSARASVLTVTLPRREYESFAVRLGAGKLSADGLTGERFSAEIASGSAVFGIFAAEISAVLRSGQVELYNCGINRAVRLFRLEGKSGQSVIRGFQTERFELDQKSGALTAEGISGKGEIRLKSGTMTVGYADWNQDLSVSVTSGNVRVLLPHGAGAYLSTNVVSGNVTASLDSDSAKLGRGSSSVKVGGGNLHALSVGVTSGLVQIKNGETVSAVPAGASSSAFVQNPPYPPPVPPKNHAPDTGKIIGAILVDVFVFSWALPVLASLVTALFACALSFAVSGVTSFVGGVMMGVTDVSSWFSSGFSPISTVLLGALMTVGAILVFLLSMKAATGFINVILRIVNWHARAVVGRNVCTLIGKKYGKDGNTV